MQGKDLELRHAIHGEWSGDFLPLSRGAKSAGAIPYDMRSLKRGTSVVGVTLLLACVRGVGSPTPAASPLALRIVLTKPESFEGEPIYALFELRNVGSDTVRIPPFGVNAGWLAAVLHRADGSVVPGGRSMWVDYACVGGRSDGLLRRPRSHPGSGTCKFRRGSLERWPSG